MFDKTCAVCGGMVGDYGPEHGWMHIVSQYDNTPHDVVLSDEPEVGSPQDKIGTERQDHLPECDLSKPCDNWKPHDMNNSGWNRCYRCEAGCICDRLRACEQRVRADERSWEGAVVVARAGYQDGYDAALRDASHAVEELTIPHHIPLEVTCDIWNQVIGECITAIKGDQS